MKPRKIAGVALISAPMLILLLYGMITMAQRDGFLPVFGGAAIGLLFAGCIILGVHLLVP